MYGHEKTEHSEGHSKKHLWHVGRLSYDRECNSGFLLSLPKLRTNGLRHVQSASRFPKAHHNVQHFGPSRG